MKLLCFTLSLFVNLIIISIATTASAAPAVWVISSLERVSQSSASGNQQHTELFAAKGEYESFQVVVKATGSDLSNVNVTVSDLTGTTGTISRSNITLYREHFVRAEQSMNWSGMTYRPLGPGMYPDALIPFKHPDTGADLTGNLDAVPFSLPMNNNGVIWIDLYVPRNTSAGVYTGTVTVTSNQGQATVPITLTVWNFTLPIQPALKTSFQIWSPNRNLSNELELLRNRLSTAFPSSTTDEPTLVASGLNIVGDNHQHSTNLYWGRCTGGSEPPSVSELLSDAGRHPSGLPTYIYSIDEIYPEDCTNWTSEIAPLLKRWGANIHKAGLLHLAVMTPQPSLYYNELDGGRSTVDIWVIHPGVYDRDLNNINFARNNNIGKLWSYNTMVQDDNSPKWLIDYPLLDHRIFTGFLNQSLDMIGLLYWRVDFAWDQSPWTSPNSFVDSSGWPYPGEGMLLYPGNMVGLAGDRGVPSMRLKAIRDGVDDYDYVELLKNRGYGAWARSKINTVAVNWHIWSKDPSQLAVVRRQLGEQLHALAAGGPTPTPTPIARCDLNSSGSINVADVQLCTNQAIGLASCTNGDVDSNGQCNVLDLQKVVNGTLGGRCP